MRMIKTMVLAGTTLLTAASAGAQEATPAYTAEQLTQMLASPASPSFTAGELTAILAPKPATRSLSAGEGPAPGDPGSGVVPNLQITFEFNSFELTRGARATLDELAKAMTAEELSELKFEIAGHTDAKGSDRYNEELSRKRAAAVVSYLEERRGVPGTRLQAKGYGEREPWDKADPDSPMNRRVEVRTLN